MWLWSGAVQDVGDTTIEENVYDSFNQNALDAMKAPIFYPGVQIMYVSLPSSFGFLLTVA